MKFAYVVVFYSVLVSCNGYLCNLKGRCIESTLEGATTASDNQDCLKKCFDNPQCKWYSFLGEASKQCIQFSDCNTLDETCSTCLSGQRECFGNNNDCTINGCCQGVTIDYTNAQTLEECRQKCLATDGQCQWFTFNLEQKFCLLLKDCSSVSNQDQDVCTSGHVTDECSDDCMETDGCCQGTVLSYETAESVEDCRQNCQTYNGCNWFSFTLDNKLCLLMSTCDHYTQENQGVCTSGPSNCTAGPSPERNDDLILLALGRNGSGPVQSVELLDLKNNVSCTKSTNALQTSYGGVGDVISKELAMICGGVGLNASCMVLKQDVTWSMSAPLNSMRMYPGIGRIYSNTLLVTGGLGATIHDTMEYYDGQKWTLLKSRMPEHLYQHCQVTLSENRSLIIGGYTLSSGMTKRTWFVQVNLDNDEERTEFVEGPPLLANRYNLACAYDTTKKLVIVAGGGSNEDVFTELLYLENSLLHWQSGPSLPNNQPLAGFQLVFNANTDSVYLMGGKNPINNAESTSLWKLENNLQWTLIDAIQLENERSDFVAFSVPRTFMSC